MEQEGIQTTPSESKSWADNGAARAHQDFGEIAPLLLCGSLQQERFPEQILLLSKLIYFFLIIYLIFFSFPNVLKIIFSPYTQLGIGFLFIS